MNVLAELEMFFKMILASKPKAGSPPASGPKAAAPAARPPKFELDGKKWAIEFQKNNQNLVSCLYASQKLGVYLM